MFLEYYGLRDQPFGNSPDPRYLYFSNTHREALASLFYGIETGCGFLTLIASPGMGKTTLLFHLVEQLRTSAQTAFLFQTQCGSREFLRYLLKTLGVDASGQDMASMHESLNTILLSNARSGRRFVLIIDEAQNLQDAVLETVRLLSDFETPQAKLMQIVLVGQPQLADKLSSPDHTQLRQRISIAARLHPFTRVGTMVYIEYRLCVAGYEGSPLFDYEAIDLIAAHSGGIPRNINNICFNALTLAYAKRQKLIDASIVSQVLVDLDMDELTSARMISAHAGWDPLSSSFDGPDPTDESSYQEFHAAVHQAWGDHPAVEAKKEHPQKAAHSAPLERLVAGDLHLDSTPASQAVAAAPFKQMCPQLLPDKLSNQEYPGSMPVAAQVAGSLIEDGFHKEDGSQPVSEPLTHPVQKNGTGGWAGKALAAVSHASTSFLQQVSYQINQPATQSLPRERTEAPATAASATNSDRVRSLKRRSNQEMTSDMTSPKSRVTANVTKPLVRLVQKDKVLIISTAAIALLAVAIGSTMPASQGRQATPARQVLRIPKTVALLTATSQNASFDTKRDAAAVSAPVEPVLAISGAKSRASLVDSKQAATVPRESSPSRIDIEELPRPIAKTILPPSISVDAPLAPVVQSSEFPITNEMLTDAHSEEAGVAGPGGHLEVPKLLTSPPPAYPQVARSQKVQGVVVIDALVDATGKVSEMKVLTGSALLLQAATEAVRRWKFEPARLNGQPIAIHTRVNVNFHLQ